MYRAWNTTMDKPIHELEHKDCQQLITKSHGRSWLDSNIQPQEESNAYLPGKGRVTVNVTCQCSENSYFWRVIDHKYQAPCWVFLISTYIPQHITLSCVLCVEIKTTFFHFAHISYAIIKADPIWFACPQKTDSTFKVCCCPRNQIRNDISCELSADRWFIWNIKVYFLPEIQAIHWSQKCTVQFVMIGVLRVKIKAVSSSR